MSEFFLQLDLFFDNPKEPQIVLASIEPELLQEKKDRSSTKIKVNKSILSINIKAWDKTALKASVNSYLKSIILAKKTMDLKR